MTEETSSQSDAYSQAIGFYRNTIQSISNILLRSNWSELKGTSPELSTAQSQLYDIILNMEKDHTGKIDIDTLLEYLNNALVELSSASVLADQADIRLRLEAFNRIKRCREYLRLAASLIDV